MILNLKKIPVIHLGWDKTIDGKPWYLAKYDPQHFEYLYDWYDIAVTDAEGYIFFIERQYSLTKGLQHTPYPATIYNDPPPPPYFAPPPPPPTPPTPIVHERTENMEIYVPFTYSEDNLKAGMLSTFYYEPETVIVAHGNYLPTYDWTMVNTKGGTYVGDISWGDDTNKFSYATNPLDWMYRHYGARYAKEINITSKMRGSSVDIDSLPDNPSLGSYSSNVNGYNYPTFPLTANLSPLTVDVKFNLFKDISVDNAKNYNSYGQVVTDITTTTIVKTLYPYSIYLKSVSVVPDSIGKNGYDSVSLLNSTLDNRVYSVDIEGAPTTCDSGYIIKMQQILNNSYYPNMKLSFNFIDSNLTEFSYVHDDPLVEINTPNSNSSNYYYPGGMETPNGLGVLKVPKLAKPITNNYLTSLCYCTDSSIPDITNNAYGLLFDYTTVVY